MVRCLVCSAFVDPIRNTLLCSRECLEARDILIGVRIRDEEVTFEREFELIDSTPFKEGGFGRLYRARKKTDPTKVVVVKVFKQSTDAKTFEKEISAISALGDESHENIVKLLDAFHGSFMGSPHYMIVMEYIHGKDGLELVHQMKDTGQRLTFDQWKTIGQKLFSALNFLHRHDIVHRDIKPNNIMFRQGAVVNPVLIDFNLSCFVDQCTAVREGTPGYYGPEIAELGKRDEDTLALLKASDVWAMSITLIIMFTIGYPSWVYDDLEGRTYKNTAALNKCRPRYMNAKVEWVSKFETYARKRFAKDFFKTGLNTKWRKRWTAKALERYFR